MRECHRLEGTFGKSDVIRGRDEALWKGFGESAHQERIPRPPARDHHLVYCHSRKNEVVEISDNGLDGKGRERGQTIQITHSPHLEPPAKFPHERGTEGFTSRGFGWWSSDERVLQKIVQEVWSNLAGRREPPILVIPPT